MLEFRQTNPLGEHAIVFLHGGGTTHAMWKEVAARLPAYNNVLVDLPDHGGSRHIRFAGFEDTACHVRDVLACIEQPAITIAGLSLGGYIGAAVGAMNLPRVTGLFISGINVDPLPGKWWLMPLSYAMLPFLKFGPLMRSNARMMGIPEKQMAEFMDGSRQMNRRAFLKIATEACDYNASDALLKTQVPVLFVAGAQENKVVTRSISEMPKRAAHVDAYLVPDVGHIWTAQEPDLCARILKAFIAGGTLPDALVRAKQI
ncbi:MAG: alpha/beta hydrolase [Pseudomonadota bacterium]